MNTSCDATARRSAADLGFDCADAHPIATLRHPADLANWTLPVLELPIVAGPSSRRRTRSAGYGGVLGCFVAATPSLVAPL